jgi:hypothetical protein
MPEAIGPITHREGLAALHGLAEAGAMMSRCHPRAASLLAWLLVPACSASSSGPPPMPSPPPREAPPHGAPGKETRILSEADAQRLRANKGLTLQWIDWDTRGTAIVTPGTPWRLRGSQAAAGGPGRLFLDGAITEIGAGYFTFEGTIRITDTPDLGRSCGADKTWRFAITQNRSYYRLREFEWCDRLTDYIDLYF